MIIQRFIIPNYDWKVVVLHNTNVSNKAFIIKTLKEICDDDYYISKAESSIDANKPNQGFIYSNVKTKCSIINIGYATNTSEYIDTIIHEANHLQSHIASYYNLDEKGEEVCYLIAHIVKTIYKDFAKIISK